MILKWVSLGIPVAGFFAAGVIAAEAESAPVPEAKKAGEVRTQASGAPRARHRVVNIRVVKDEENSEDKERETVVTDNGESETVVLHGEDAVEEVRKAVSEALTEAREALEEVEEEIRVELDGKELEAMTEKHREALEKARERLEEVGKDVAERAEDVEVRISRATERAAEAAKKAGEALKETRVIIVRGGGKDSRIEIEKDEKGRTLLIIEGDDVKVISGEKRKKEKADTPKE